MSISNTAKNLPISELTTGIVAAYVTYNAVPISELPAFIVRIHHAISDLALGRTLANAATAVLHSYEKPSPTQIRESVQHDRLISFFDGRPYKMLKRHLTAHGSTPERYRAKFGLPDDYPMVAPSYAELRSALAKAIGLGQPGAMANRERKTTPVT